MYYDIVNKMDHRQEMDYDLEEIDGQPRYRWYKGALNSVHMISCIDDIVDIHHKDFSDLKYYYDCIRWVAHNDPEALKHIMGAKTEPVSKIVKQKLIDHLQELEYYKSCALVKKHLRTFQPVERDFKRKEEKFISLIDKDIVKNMSFSSGVLYDLKTKHKDVLFSQDKQEIIRTLLNIDHKILRFRKVLDAMDWLSQNAPESLKKLFAFKVCQEIKDQLLGLLTEYEMFRLCVFIDKTIPVYQMDFYYDIPPYIEPFTFEDDDWEDDD